MIKSFAKILQEHKDELSWQEHPNWDQIVFDVFYLISKYWDSEVDDLSFAVGKPYLDNIHEINDSDYSGSIVFLIPDSEFKPEYYFVAKVFYGSCSASDTLLQICDEENGTPTEKQNKLYRRLALNIAQRIAVI